MAPRFLWSSIVVASVLLAGCAGGSGDEPLATPDVDGGVGATGTVSGKVLDDEQRPVGDAVVSVVGENLTATTDPEGDFRLNSVPTGPQTLNVTHDEHEPKTHDVTVEAGQEAALMITLVPLPTEDAFFVTYPFVGFQQCMWYTAVFKAACSYPYTALYWSAHENGYNLSSYGAPEDVMDNKYRYNFSVEADHTGIVSELAWTAATDAAKYYQLELSCAWYDPVVDDCVAPGQTTWEASNTYARARGVSPLRIEWQHDRPEWLPWVMSRAYLSSDVSLPMGLSLEQRVEMYNTVFYGAPPPDDFRVWIPST